MLARVQYPFPAVSSALKPVRECQSELLRTARRRDDRRRQRRRDRRDRRHRQGGAEMVNSNLAIASEREVLYTVEITFKWVLRNDVNFLGSFTCSFYKSVLLSLI